MERITKILQAIESKSGEQLWQIQSDDKRIMYTFGNSEKPFFIASATKLFVTTILAQMRLEKKISWNDPLTAYLPDIDTTGLVRENFDDLTDQITIREVMAHTSGLPDYFEGKRGDGSNTFNQCIEKDFAWNIHDVVSWSKALKPIRRGKSLYSDTGYQLLGALIERVDQKSFNDSLMQRISMPLDLKNTFCFNADHLNSFGDIAKLKNGKSDLNIPLAMSSVQADGGIVSTTDDAVVFLRAFFGGQLFDPSLHSEIQTEWHRIFPPFQYGTGIMKFELSPLMTGFRKVPAAFGHGGASGTVIFRVPDLGVNIIGTTNQIQNRSLSYRTMVKIIMNIQK